MGEKFSVPFLLLISISCLTRYTYSTPLVDCSGVENNDKIFLESSASIFRCQQGSLKQKGCYIESERTGQQCVWLEDLTKNVAAQRELRDYLKDRGNLNCTKLMSNRDALHFLRTRARLFRDCTEVIENGEKKYETRYWGNPLCNVNGMQTYNLHNKGWEKCDENGEFELKSCPTIDPIGRCVSAEELYDRIAHIPRGSPGESDIHRDNKPLCERVEYWTELLSGEAISTKCTFDSPVKINKTKTSTTASTTLKTTTTTKTTTTPTEPTTSTSKPTTSTTSKPTTSTTTKPTTTTSSTTKKATTTTKKVTSTESTTTEEPKRKCKNGQYYNVYYHKNKPTHCVFPNEERSCLNIEIMNEVIPNKYLPTNARNWDSDKEKQISEKLKYMGKWQGGWEKVHYMKHGSKRRARQTFDEYVGRLAYDEDEYLFSNIGPYSYCNFLLNYFPLKNSILFEESEETCPEPECDPDENENGNPGIVRRSYPKPIRNVWYEVTQAFDDGFGWVSATKCYINYVPGDKKCVSLKNAMNLLSAVSDPSDLKDVNKKLATAAKMRMFDVTIGRTEGYDFDRMMRNRVFIGDIMSALSQEAIGIEDLDEYFLDIYLNGTKFPQMSITSFCAIFGELIPIKFDQDYVDTHFHECSITIDESDFPASVRSDPYKRMYYTSDSDEAQTPIDSDGYVD